VQSQGATPSNPPIAAEQEATHASADSDQVSPLLATLLLVYRVSTQQCAGLHLGHRCMCCSVRIRVNKLMLPKFIGFGPTEFQNRRFYCLWIQNIQKICKKTRMNFEQIGEDIFQKRHRLVC
jgi:hypothetical protein